MKLKEYSMRMRAVGGCADLKACDVCDSLDRLISESTFSASVTSVVQYSYDLLGNRTQTTGPGATNTYTLGTGNRLASWGASGTVSYADAGNVTNIVYNDGRTVSIDWNDRYEIAAVYTNGSLAETYGYDALGRRVWISDGTTTNYLIHDGQHVVAEVDASGSLQRSYTYGPSVDDILAMTDHTSTQTYYYVKDHLGSVVAIVDSTGTNVVETYGYDAYGQVTVYTNGTEVSESTVGNRYTFQGREISWKTRLYHFRARSYCPVIGRWLSKDRIGISGGLDQYVAFDDNPVNFRDPLGLCTDGDTTGAFEIAGSSAALIGGVTGGASFVWDSQGNRGIALTGGVGAGVYMGGNTLWNGLLGRITRFAERFGVRKGSIDDLKGGGVQAKGAAGIGISAEIDVNAPRGEAPARITGIDAGLGGAVFKTYTVVIPVWRPSWSKRNEDYQRIQALPAHGWHPPL